MKHVNPFKHTTAEDYEHFLSYMWASGARHNALLCQAYFDGADAPHEEYEAYMETHPEQAEQEPVAWRVRGYNQFKTGNPAPWRYVDGTDKPTVNIPDCCDFEPLYAAPVHTKDLTDYEILAVARGIGIVFDESDKEQQIDDIQVFARVVIAADREKNK